MLADATLACVIQNGLPAVSAPTRVDGDRRGNLHPIRHLLPIQNAVARPELHLAVLVFVGIAPAMVVGVDIGMIIIPNDTVLSVRTMASTVPTLLVYPSAQDLPPSIFHQQH